MRLVAAILAAWFGTVGSFAAWTAEIPQDAWAWRRTLTREGQSAWGLNAPISDFGAQIHQESAWKPNARSPVGAYGLAQVMPATGEWLAGAYPSLGPKAQPASPAWAIRALVTYDKHIWDRASAATPCDRMAKTLVGFNGGPARIPMEERLTAAAGLDPRFYWGHMERFNSGRSAANFRENRDYPVRILIRLAPVYVRHDWGPTSCDDY